MKMKEKIAFAVAGFEALACGIFGVGGDGRAQ